MNRIQQKRLKFFLKWLKEQNSNAYMKFVYSFRHYPDSIKFTYALFLYALTADALFKKSFIHNAAPFRWTYEDKNAFNWCRYWDDLNDKWRKDILRYEDN